MSSSGCGVSQGSCAASASWKSSETSTTGSADSAPVGSQWCVPMPVSSTATTGRRKLTSSLAGRRTGRAPSIATGLRLPV
jgi:hypothetical protein